MNRSSFTYTRAAVAMALAAVLALGLLGCGQVARAAETKSDTQGKDVSVVQEASRFQLTLTPGEENTSFSRKELDGRYDGTLTYVSLGGVTITLDGKKAPLEEAIRKGDVAVEEIFAWARMDARDGLCKETYESDRGLTRFTYQYPDFRMEIMQDVYETPDGGSYLMNSMTICPSDVEYQGGLALIPEGSSRPIDMEDWGLSFEVLKADDSGVTLRCAQSGGQQAGSLKVFNYTIVSTAGDGAFYPPSEKTSQDIALTMGGSTEFTIRWKDAHGALPAGEYFLRLNVQDDYNPETIHPLIRKFYDKQSYDVKFTVSE